MLCPVPNTPQPCCREALAAGAAREGGLPFAFLSSHLAPVDPSTPENTGLLPF